MNKYSSKAVKTAATVGMSLAMVLGNVAPVFAASTQTVCTSETTVKKDEVVAKFNNIELAKDSNTIKTEAKNKFNSLIKDAPTKAIMLNSKGLTINTKLQYSTDNGTTYNDATVITNEFDAINNTIILAYTATEAKDYYDDKDEHKTIAVNDVVETVAEFDTTATRGENEIEASIKSELEKLYDDEHSSLSGDITTWEVSVDYVDRNGENQKADFSVKVLVDGVEITKKSDLAAAANTIEVRIVADDNYTHYNCDEVEVGEGIKVTTESEAKNVYKEIVAAFDKADVTFETVKPGDKVKFEKANTSSLNEITILDKETKKMNIDFKATLKELSRFLDGDSDEGKAVARLYEMEDAMNDMFEDGGYLDQAKKYDEDYEFTKTQDYAKAVELLEDFNDFDTYISNLSTDDADDVTEAKSVLEDLVEGYVAENDGDLLDGYLTKLDKFYEAFVEEHKENGIEKSDVDKAIKSIKEGGEIGEGKDKVILEKSDYTTFKENSSVEEYMTKFEEMYDEIQAVKDAVAKSNEAYKALIDGDTSVKDFLTGKDDDRKLTKDKEFSSIKSQITVDEFKILKAYKEEVVDTVLTMEAKEVGNSYVNKSEKSMFATKAQLKTVLSNIGNIETDVDGLNKGVFTKLDKETGEFNWDKLVAHMEKVEASLEAVTTGIDKLDAISLTANDREAILAADDAVYFLLGDGADNLTSAQTRTVKNADRKVAELMEAYRKNFGSLNVELNGWINKGNGDYAYYENGIAPAYKWVASGANWYFVKDGVMMRNYWLATDGGRWYYLDNEGKMVKNQSVDGCWINSYGVYMSPSYNG